MVDFLELDSEDSGVYEISEGAGEYFLKGLLEGEYEGTFGKDAMVISISFHKGLPCGVVISGGREDDNEPKKLTDYFHFPASFFSFLTVFSISR